MILEVPQEQQVVGGFVAKFPGRGGGDRPVVDRVEVAAGGQHIEAATRRRAGGPGGDELAVEPGEEGGGFGGAGGAKPRADGGVDGGEDGARGVP